MAGVNSESGEMTKRGRPRAFDRSEALRVAMELFWTHGYEGVSVKMLTDRLGITPTSLYAAFGSKEELFDEAVEMYDPPGDTPTDRALRIPNVREAVEALLRQNASAYVDPATPTGCMIVLSAVNLGADHHHIGEKLTARRHRDLDKIRTRLQHGRDDHELPSGLDVEQAAGFLHTVLHGLSIQARDGLNQEQAEAIVDVAMHGWDSLIRSAAAAPAG